ncbi:unnamed protein product [Leptosia nina]|uniref:Uncharacterized protein n=1 Tax=Leptosia nina TaxID=320188 RepID=A0AAV1JPR9_9NEOP
MDEYKNVLQILFNYRLKNKDLRGCTEILRNCKVLGISLPSHLQSHFITLFIGAKKDDKPLASKPENFKLKF